MCDIDLCSDAWWWADVFAQLAGFPVDSYGVFLGCIETSWSNPVFSYIHGREFSPHRPPPPYALTTCRVFFFFLKQESLLTREGEGEIQLGGGEGGARRQTPADLLHRCEAFPRRLGQDLEQGSTCTVMSARN